MFQRQLERVFRPKGFFLIAASLALTSVPTSDALELRTAVSAGYMHTLALKPDGTVWAWGQNGHGQLGNGSDTDSNDTVRVLNLDTIVAISAGEHHSLALRADGTVWAWGANHNGQLGDGSNLERHIPAQVQNLANVVAISAGMSHSLAVKSDGTVWAWGQNPYGELGNGSSSSEGSNIPVQVVESAGGTPLSGIVSVAAGGYHSLALAANGTVWAWGSNIFGQLGSDLFPQGSNVPVKVISSSGSEEDPLAGVQEISAGELHSLALKSDGSVWAWGSNASGQLGNGSTVSSPIPVPVIPRVDWPENIPFSAFISISAGYAHSLALCSDGRLYAWGWNAYGQLGSGDSLTEFSNLPIQVMESLPNSPLTGIVSISAGMWHSVALHMDAAAYGTVLGWGANTSGQLGTGEWGEFNNPLPLPSSFSFAGEPPGVVSVSAGAHHSLALMSDNSIWAWGNNSEGQLGTAAIQQLEAPRRVIESAGGSPFNGAKAISAGNDHSLALKLDGTVWAWGSGYLGNGVESQRSYPIQVDDLSHQGIKTISAGGEHSLALSYLGRVYGWGNNAFEQINSHALGFDAYLETPQLIYLSSTQYLDDIVAISAGERHSLALASDGTVWAWGDNLYGQLGTGDNLDKSVPTKVVKDNVSPLTGIIAISAGEYYSMALASDGTVWAWGTNYVGQLGNGAAGLDAHSNIPVQVLSNNGRSLTGVKAISAGSTLSTALKSDGTVWVWGNRYNSPGYEYFPTAHQLLSGDARPAYPLTTVADISTGNENALFLKANGTVWAKGFNNHGELGILSHFAQELAMPTCFLPDLIVSDIEFDVVTPPTVPLNIIVSVENQGGRDVQGVIGVDFFEHSQTPPDNIAGDASCQIDGLAAGEMKTCTVQVTYAIDGDYTIWANVDGGEVIPEYFEDNNLFHKARTIRSPGIDLAVIELSVSSSTVEPGDPISITDTTRNMGSESSSPAGMFTTTTYFLSKDTSWDASDRELFSRPVPVLGSATENSGTTVFTIPVDTPLDNYHLLACADYPDSTSESNENNNCLTVSILIGRPDLIVSVVYDPPAIADLNKPITLADVTRNIGTVATKNVTYTTYYLVSSGGDEFELWPPRTIPAMLQPKTDNMGSVTVTPQRELKTGDYQLKACANSYIPLIEIPGTNNNCNTSVGTVFLTRPDLIVNSLSGPPAYVNPGSRIRVSDSTMNSSAVASDNTYTKYFLSRDQEVDLNNTSDEIELGDRNVGILPAYANNYQELWFTVKADTAYGEYYLVACADGRKAINENSESNNCRASSSLMKVGKPDLIVAALSKTRPGNGETIGGRITVSETTRNIGTIPTLSSTSTSYFLSTDRLKGSDIYLGERVIDSGLQPQTDSTGTRTLTIPTSTRSGRYYLLACADISRNPKISSIVEENENNNCLSTDMDFIVSLPNLKVQSVYAMNPLPNSPLTNDGTHEFSIWDTTINSGAVPTLAETDVSYYISQSSSICEETWVGDHEIPLLDAGDSVSTQARIVIPLLPLSPRSTPYTYYICACADVGRIVRETAEWDNCKYLGSTIQIVAQ